MKTVIMIDLDGVVLNKNYKTTKDIIGTVRRLTENEGFLLVPNSDTPSERLMNLFSVNLGFYPEVVVAENGAVVSLESRDILPFNVGGIDSFKSDFLKVFTDLGYCVKIGDSTTWIRERKRFEPNVRLIILDGFRKQSIGFFIKKTDGDGIPQTNQELSVEVLSLLSAKLEPPTGLGKWGYNPSYGIAISNVRHSTKTVGYQVLKEIYPDLHFYMIGDSDADIIQDESVKICSVRNGSEALKRIAWFTAKNDFTAGLEECLKQIERVSYST